MNVACIFLTCGRVDLTLQCIKQNFFNAEKDADVFLIDNGSDPGDFEKIKAAYPFTGSFRFDENKGIAAALNKGIELIKEFEPIRFGLQFEELSGALNYDAIMTLANDILMPQGWLRVLCQWVEKIPNTGMAGIHCVEGLPDITALGVHEVFTPFGNALIPMGVIEKIGGFNTAFDPYGMQDSDYAHRLHIAGGFVNYYVPGLKSEHIGHDMDILSDYREMKNEGLKKAPVILEKALKKYNKSGKVFIDWKK